MFYQEIPVQVKGSLPGAKLTLYIQDYSADMLVQERPMIIICPGGGYEHLSVREGESMALQFMAMGLHAAVLRYSVAPAAYPVQITELAYAMKYIREHVKEWHIQENKIIVHGSSAGGHLAASLGVFWKEEWLYKSVGAECAEEIRPDGMLLSYPVITSGEFAHRGSFDKLLGKGNESKPLESANAIDANAGEISVKNRADDEALKEEDLLEKLSLEKQVNADTPPAFIWHTFEDGTVPMENSLFFVSALRKFNIPTEFHLYPKGQHGLALGTALTASAGGKHMQAECASWINLAKIWIENL
ncbi:MAG: alpha/beta hydrolase [Lachnospiraceae bacterium]|nr:alpha/beta hydrolase [Lachnospiraceae bacterium]